MTNTEIFNVIRDLIEVSVATRNTNPKYPQYVKYFVESGDKASIDYLDYPIMVIENHLDSLKEYASVVNYLPNENRFIFGAYSVKSAFMEIRDFCKARITYCPAKYESEWRDLYNKIHKIIITLAADMSLISKFTVHLDGKEYHVDLMVDGSNIEAGDEIFEVLQIVCDKYSNNHGVKVRLNWEEVKEDDDVQSRNE